MAPLLVGMSLGGSGVEGFWVNFESVLYSVLPPSQPHPLLLLIRTAPHPRGYYLIAANHELHLKRDLLCGVGYVS